MQPELRRIRRDKTGTLGERVKALNTLSLVIVIIFSTPFGDV